LNRIDPSFHHALELIYGKLSGIDIVWAVTGSLGFALRGIPVRPHDIDIQTDEKGAYSMEDIFAEYLVRKVGFSSTDNLRSHFGAFMINGIKCEIMGDIEKRLSNGTWSPAPDLRKHIEHIRVNEMDVPVLSLRYECEAYMQLGREDKARMLQQWLRQHGSSFIGENGE
jgi:hypothetical protein